MWHSAKIRPNPPLSGPAGGAGGRSARRRLAVVGAARGKAPPDPAALRAGGRVGRDQRPQEVDARRLEVAQEDDVVEVAHGVEVAEAHALLVDEPHVSWRSGRAACAPA